VRPEMQMTDGMASPSEPQIVCRRATWVLLSIG